MLCTLAAQLTDMLTDSLLSLRTHFNSGATLSYAARMEKLQKLKAALLHYEEDIYTALAKDLGKSKEESWVTETGKILGEIKFAMRHLQQWMKPEKVATNLLNFPSKSYILREPLGVVLIIGPWNYPLLLLLNPLVGALAAGNTVVLKPSEHAPSTAAIIKKIIDENYRSDEVLLVEGDGAQVVPEMMNQFRFDHVFYTGSTNVGRLVYKMAADKLVPVTLELGGKSPCVVEKDADLKVAAKRIAVTKFSNCGQMCVAPDYLLVHASVKEKLIHYLIEYIERFYGKNPEQSYNYGRLIDERHYNRLMNFLERGKIVYGGRRNQQQLYIAPTLLEDVHPEDPIMQEEIFGPLLPIISFQNSTEAKAIIQQNPNPLAFYLFTSSSQIEKEWLHTIPFGGGCINNCSWHLTNQHLPFGGRGNSGMGRYHGRYSFETFSHPKSILKTPTWFDPAVKYPPLKGKLSLFKKFTG